MIEIKNNVMTKVLSQIIKPINDLDDSWVIITKDGLFSTTHGRQFYDSYDQAWKHWYNEAHWLIKGRFKEDYNISNGLDASRWNYSGPFTDRQIWESFKQKMIEEYDLQILQWKDARKKLYGTERNGESSKALL